MKTALLTLWLAAPLGLLAYHYGPGQDRLKEDAAARHVQAARDATSTDDAEAALQAYDEALAALPAEARDEARRIKLARAKLRMLNAGLPIAEKELQALLQEVEADSSADAELRDETRAAFASAKYYMTWLMRLEGRPETEWRPEIEAARQHFRLLAEAPGIDEGSPAARERQENLESSIKLARMELTELQGLPLPKQ